MTSRRKGHDAEREVARILRDRLAIDARRGYQSYKGGQLEPDVCGLPGFHLEIKRCESLRLPAWLRQAETDAAAGDVPVVVFRRSREPWRVCLSLDAFLDLLGVLEWEGQE